MTTFQERFRAACIRAYVYALDRLSEGSTLRAIVMLMTSAGVAIAPGKIDLIVTVGLFVVGILGAIFPDRLREIAKEQK